MTVDARTLELINLELDGELDEAGRRDLEAQVRANPEVARHREELQRVASLLGELPATEVPEGFAAQVVASARFPRSRQESRRRRRQWQLGVALAASAVFGAVALWVLGPAMPTHTGQLTGAMIPSLPTVAAQETDWGQRLHFRIPPGPEARIDIRFRDGKRIVIPLAESAVQLSIETPAGEFTAELTRNGTVTPITEKSR